MEHLDGNAAGGVLLEVFAHEMTTAMGTCASCGTTAAMATAHVYMGGPGTVLRCPNCGDVLMCIVDAGGDVHLDLSGLRRIVVR
jgi:ribosomal protein S27E